MNIRLLQLGEERTSDFGLPLRTRTAVQLVERRQTPSDERAPEHSRSDHLNTDQKDPSSSSGIQKTARDPTSNDTNHIQLDYNDKIEWHV